jgi:hypothetical protein
VDLLDVKARLDRSIRQLQQARGLVEGGEHAAAQAPPTQRDPGERIRLALRDLVKLSAEIDDQVHRTGAGGPTR